MASVEDTKPLLFKVDFEKAFNSVNWSFLIDSMRQMGFGSKWRGWISSCLSSASISVLVNVSPSKEFKLERGLRQGNPLSPFLFLIVVEALQVSILEACDNGLYKGIFLANSLKINFDKSRVFGVGVLDNKVVSMASSLGCIHDSLPFFYVGLSLGKGMNTCIGWNVVINRFRDKLFTWKSKYLSIGGRLTLVKWNSIILDKDKEGLGVGSLLSKNIGLLCKWKWRFLMEENALWYMVIKKFYGKDRGFDSTVNSHGVGGIWCDIIKTINKANKLVSSFKTSFVIKVANGNNTRFWLDPCSNSGVRLADVFPRLHAIDQSKDCTIADRWHFSNNVWGGNWNWHIPPRGRALDDLSNMINLIGNLELSSSGLDKWRWACDKSGMVEHLPPFGFPCVLHLGFGFGLDYFSWLSKANVCLHLTFAQILPSTMKYFIVFSTTCLERKGSEVEGEEEDNK
uniref:Arginine repressor C-terminal-like domain-containing protein n=1 Tax=Tanacetum cinerariifolium TaxID=118510 RepID=A0A6L2M2S9_TANCI|nr:arginine repressor C-terminal-like domain-containing protein [Tanacetum cinerariifolium]